MPDMEMTTVGIYLSEIEAELARSALAAAGIAAHLRADDCGGMRPHMQVSGVELLVSRDDAADARALLEAAEHTHPEAIDE